MVSRTQSQGKGGANQQSVLLEYAGMVSQVAEYLGPQTDSANNEPNKVEEQYKTHSSGSSRRRK